MIRKHLARKGMNRYYKEINFMLLDIQVVGVGGDSLECFLGIFLITLLLRCACTTLEASNRETDWRENQTQT